MEEQSNCSRDLQIQATGSFVSAENKRNLAELYKKLYQIDRLSQSEQVKVFELLEKSLECFDPLLPYMVPQGTKLLGSSLTKHGELAEHMNVAYINAIEVIRGKAPIATFDNVGRTAPEDFLVNGIKVQSKYYEKTAGSLNAVLGHIKQYEHISFGRDGSYYMIPKDQYQEMVDIINGHVDNIHPNKVHAIREKIQQIESETGHSVFEIVKSGNFDYVQVKLENAPVSILQEQQHLRENAQEQISDIKRDSEQQRQDAKSNAAPSWHKAATAAGISAGISGGLQLAFGIQRKCKQGKKIQDFTVDDWKDIGLDTTKAAAEGGVSGLAIYGMTNFANVPSPIAAAGISLSFGLVELTHEYRCHRITKADFTNGCQTICINSVISAVGAFVGERLIPIPVLGSIIGSAIAGNIGKELLGQGLHDAILNASLYVHGSTVSMLDAAKEISYNNMVTTRNIGEIQEIHTQIVKDTEEFFSQMRGLL